MSSLTLPCTLTHTDSPDLTRKIYPLSTHYSSVIDEWLFSEYGGFMVLNTCCFDPHPFIYVGCSEARRSAGQTRQVALRWTPRELNLIRAAVQFERRDDSLLTTETDVVLQVDDSLICLIPPSSWKRSPMGPPKGGEGDVGGGFGFA